MLDKYEVIDRLIILGGYTGRFMVWIGMLAGCILIWYFVFALIFNN